MPLPPRVMVRTVTFALSGATVTDFRQHDGRRGDRPLHSFRRCRRLGARSCGGSGLRVDRRDDRSPGPTRAFPRRPGSSAGSRRRPAHRPARRQPACRFASAACWRRHATGAWPWRLAAPPSAAWASCRAGFRWSEEHGAAAPARQSELLRHRFAAPAIRQRTRLPRLPVWPPEALPAERRPYSQAGRRRSMPWGARLRLRQLRSR